MKRYKGILAEGEVTGHAHRLGNDIEVLEVEDGYREFNLSKSMDLTHEEHYKITLPTDYLISGIVLEYDHFQEEAREVVD